MTLFPRLLHLPLAVAVLTPETPVAWTWTPAVKTTNLCLLTDQVKSYFCSWLTFFSRFFFICFFFYNECEKTKDPWRAAEEREADIWEQAEQINVLGSMFRDIQREMQSQVSLLQDLISCMPAPAPHHPAPVQHCLALAPQLHYYSPSPPHYNHTDDTCNTFDPPSSFSSFLQQLD